MHIVSRILLLASSLLLVSCGGVGGPTSTNITADRLIYGSTITLTIDGPNLDKGITVVAPKCTGLKEQDGSTTSMRA